jgi:xylose isomerase
MEAFIGKKEYFPGIGKIKFEGVDSRNPLAFKWYDETRVINGKTMKDHLRFAIAYWHTFCGDGGDPFGPGTKNFPWTGAGDKMEGAFNKLDAAFEFISKIGASFYCFHDTDIVGDGSVFEIEKRMSQAIPVMQQITERFRSTTSLGYCQCILEPPLYERSIHQSRF